MGFDLWIFGATHSELKLIIRELGAIPWREMDGCFEAEVEKDRIGIATVGVGMPRACFRIGKLLGLFPSPTAIMIGSCGAFPGSALAPGDLLVAEGEILSELGVVQAEGIGNSGPLAHLGLEQELAMSGRLADELLLAASAVSRAKKGRLLTVLGSSPSGEVARKRASTFNALAENMEGYCLALAGKSLGIEVGELRGVSNEAGDRNLEKWDLERAQLLTQKAILQYLRRSH
jgi:futalosine hydrolase